MPDPSVPDLVLCTVEFGVPVYWELSLQLGNVFGNAPVDVVPSPTPEGFKSRKESLCDETVPNFAESWLEGLG